SAILPKSSPTFPRPSILSAACAIKRMPSGRGALAAALLPRPLTTRAASTRGRAARASRGQVRGLPTPSRFVMRMKSRSVLFPAAFQREVGWSIWRPASIYGHTWLMRTSSRKAVRRWFIHGTRKQPLC
ncbi:hypothetical protein J3459_012101, partial [Metarhizium acridum]